MLHNLSYLMTKIYSKPNCLSSQQRCSRTELCYPIQLIILITIKPFNMQTATMTNTEMAQELYDLFGQGKVSAILELLTDDIKWTCPGPTEILPYARVYNG